MRAPLIVLAVVLLAAPAFAEPVWVVSNGFHSSLGFRAADLPEWRVRGADHFLIGWGDAAWYRGRNDFPTFVSAVFWPSRSVLLVVPVKGAIASRFTHSDVVRLDLPPGQFAKLRSEIAASFARDPRGRPLAAGPGFVADSRFFASRESFYFPKMCNYWIAEKLRRAGVRVSGVHALRARSLVRQVAGMGTREQRLQKPPDPF